ncbi:MAG TPA: hypothetical protein VEL76_09745 [Gemmataceae bacterium]|nr:hypothetical protein [Gemmataceae bacterium]
MRCLSLLATVILGAAITTTGVGCKGGDKKLTIGSIGDQTVKQDASTDVKISITRDKVDDEVTITVTGLPDKVTAEPATLKLAKDKNDGTITLKAAADAKAEDGKEITVKASGGGVDQTAKFKLNVKAKG